MSHGAKTLIAASPSTETGRRIQNVLDAYPERIVPDETAVGIVSWHLKKYDFAARWCERRFVLDAGCGVGYGTFWLSRVATALMGVDLNPDAIAYAKRRYANRATHFLVADLGALPCRDQGVDVVCAFEVIEHLPDAPSFLVEVRRVLRPDGTFFVSTPQVRRTARRPRNPHHHMEYSFADFHALLSRFFMAVDVLGQRRLQSSLHYYLQRLDILRLRQWLLPRFLRRELAGLLHTTPTEDLDLSDLEITREGISRATELFAICSRPRQP